MALVDKSRSDTHAQHPRPSEHAPAAVADRAPAASPAGNPPKPRLTLRVGISGHRPKPGKFPQKSFARVREQLGATFAAIDEALVHLRKANGNFYADEPHKVRLVSGLAEGADLMAVDARPPEWDLDAVLPFPVESYRKDFEHSARDRHVNVVGDFEAALGKATAVVQLPDDPQITRQGLTPEQHKKEFQRLRDKGYARAGAFLLHQLDLLVAVWDGKSESGPGGTAEILRGAIDASVPVIWISSLENIYPRLIDDIEPDGAPVAPPADCLQGRLADAISTIVSVPPDPPRDAASHGLSGPSIKKRLATFFGESWPRPTHSVTYDVFKRLTEWRRPRWRISPESWATYRNQWTEFTRDAPHAGDLGEHIETVLMPRYAWADALAVERSHWYRAAYFNGYLLAALAVLVALLGPFSEIWFTHAWVNPYYKGGMVLLEGVVIACVVYVVWRGRHGRWQEKWVEYRALAEMLRDARFLAYLGEHGSIQRTHNLEPSSAAWFLWYVRATIREVGVPNATLDGNYQRKLLIAVEKHVLNEQLHYHRSNAPTLARLHRFLHRFAIFCFAVTVVSLFIHLFAYLGWVTMGAVQQVPTDARPDGTFSTGRMEQTLKWIEGWIDRHEKLFTLFAAFPPALAAALTGIRETGDFEGFAERSAKTAVALQDLKQKFVQAQRDLSLDATSNALLSTAQVLAGDLVAWQSVYGRKALNLPA